LLALAAVFWKGDALRFDSLEDLLLLASFGAIIFCEFVHIDNLYGEQLIRLNTVFKFYSMAWWGLAIAVPIFLYRHRSELITFKKTSVIFCAGAIALSLVYTVRGTQIRSEHNPLLPTLNAIGHWDQMAPGEREALYWLRDNTQAADVILEATGPAYSHFSR